MLWYIAAGSALGGAGRYLVTGLVQRLAGTAFPYGTLLVNVTGSFLLGLFLYHAIESPGLSPEMRAFLTVGFCGGYTTFSTFSFETLILLRDGDWARASAYLGLSVVVAIAATALGFLVARQM